MSNFVLKVELIDDNDCEGCPFLSFEGFGDICKVTGSYIDTVEHHKMDGEYTEYIRPDDCPLEKG